MRSCFSFKRAILISATWHFICIFSVTPLLMQEDTKTNSTTVSFLGSILENVAAVPESPFSESGFLIEQIKRIGDISSREVTLNAPETIFRVLNEEPDKELFIFHKDRYKDVVFRSRYKKREISEIRFKGISISGEARNRMLLYKPALSGCFIFPSFFNSDYNITVAFNVSNHGFVHGAECIVSSGSAYIDQMAVRYIKKWQFIPQYETLKDKKEGVVCISFRGGLR